MLTFAKGVGNGITLAGIVGRAEIMNVLPHLSFSTFGGNPLSTAAGLATLRYVRDADLQTNARLRGAQMAARLGPVVERTPWIAELRGRGLMQAIETVHPDSIEPDAKRSKQLLEATKDRGLLIGKGGLYGNVLRLTPMLDITESEIDEGLDALVTSIEHID
jgi:4-aminobutyrate aminotransferase